MMAFPKLAHYKLASLRFAFPKLASLRLALRRSAALILLQCLLVAAVLAHNTTLSNFKPGWHELPCSLELFILCQVIDVAAFD